MAYLDPPDTIIATLTKEGRNLLARSKLGLVVYKHLGWQAGRGGYVHGNPVKVEELVDNATEAVGYIEVLSNEFNPGDKIILYGKEFEFDVHWTTGLTVPITVSNIVNAINDTDDLRVSGLVLVDIDPENANRIRIRSSVTGNVLNLRDLKVPQTDLDLITNSFNLPAHGLVDGVQVQLESSSTLPGGVAEGVKYFVVNASENTFQLSSTLNSPTLVDLSSQGLGTLSILPVGNLYPLNHSETVGLGSTTNFLVTPMSLPVSTELLDPAYPPPPALAHLVLPDGRLEFPTSTSISFVLRIPEGTVGMNAYGEVGIWAEVLESTHPMEKGRQVLFAHAHFPIQVKTDRSLFAFRVLINF